jgi:serine phosphatase RsbU (regulator of sigma subunit)
MWPADGEAIDELRAFVRQVARSNTSQNNIIRWKNRDWVAAGAPGKKLTDTVLLALYPLSEIDREIAVIRSDLTWGVLFALILALLVGSLFSQTILQPVSRLMVGVQALRRRDAGLRLEILHNDELGKLSATFNKTSEALADILSAKAIQTQLIPENAPEIPGFMADLIYLPAAELGGDYCDILPLTDSRWLLVIGDVTGHGVSSAMVTTMIKAVVIDYAMRGEFELSEMFLCLNELLYTQFRRKKCMTLLAAVIDCNSGQIDCVNSGHPLPLHFSGGKRQTLSVSGRPPLGFSTRNLEFPKFSIALQPDDCLVFYTDILIETVDCHGKPYGSDGLAAICSSFLHLSPSSMLNGIVDVVKSGVGGEFDDDLTLMIIKRKTYDEVKHAG